MASWNIPALVNKISDDVPAIKALLTALFKWTDADTTDVPVGAKRLQDVAGGKQMQEYSGSSWGSVGKLMHDVDMLDGKHATNAQTPNTIPVRDANGFIPGNITGNAATATSTSGLASDYVVPIANGGTGATSEAGARASLGADNASNISSGILDIAYGGTGSSQKNFVDLTENQTVGGTKTFSSEIKSTAETLVSTVMNGVSIADTTRGQYSAKILTAAYDKDGKRFASIVTEALASGGRTMFFQMRNRADSAWLNLFMLRELADGTVQTLAKTPPAAADDTQIATTAWVRSATGNTSLTSAAAIADGSGNTITSYYCNLSGAQTVSGKKTFTGGVDIYSGVQGQVASLNIRSNYNNDEGGQINFFAPDAGTQYNGFFIDNYKGKLRILGLPSADGTSKTGTGTTLSIDVYGKTITGGYTFTGNVTGNCSGTAANVTGTVAIANGGTGATDYKVAVKNLFNKYIGSSVSHVLCGTSGFGDSGYITQSDLRTWLNCLLLSGGTMTGQLVINHANTGAGGGIKLTGAGQNYALSISNTYVTKGTAPSSIQYWGIDFYGKDVASYNQRIAMIDANLSTSNVSGCFLRAYNCTSNTNTGSCAIGALVDGSGNGYTYAPTPPAADDSTKIATTAWVRGRLSNTEFCMVPNSDPDYRVPGTTYTAATNGFFKVEYNDNHGNYDARVRINGHLTSMHCGQYGSGGQHSGGACFFPVKKGWTYVASGNCNWCGFQSC